MQTDATETMPPWISWELDPATFQLNCELEEEAPREAQLRVALLKYIDALTTELRDMKDRIRALESQSANRPAS